MNNLDRRNFLQITGAGLASTSFSQGAHAAQKNDSKSSDQPNVVLIISDDQGFTDYGFMGHPVIQTPHLDRLANQSVVYTRGYVTTALCCPSLSTLLTGLYPHQHKVTGNDPVDIEKRHLWYEAFERCSHLPALLADAGYVSFQSGKYWMGHYSRAGFTDGMTTKGRHGDAGLEIGRSTMQPIYKFIDQAQKDKKPFFVWYAPFMPHLPHTPPQDLEEKYRSAGEKAKYYAMCDWFDQTCGQLLDHLDQRNLSENTIVMYLADNGWPQPYKGSPYELGVRTPIMIRWPKKYDHKMDVENLANSIDIAPTILTACGIQPPAEMPGVNLLDFSSVAARDMIFLENFAHDMADVNDAAKSLRARSCIQGDWKLIVWQENQPELRTSGKAKPVANIELYNLKEDPFEKINLAEKHPDKVDALKKCLDEWWNPMD
ncbi:MAG: sulfatase [Candidatus Omnitrophica bacterium]|nr:sulfatase [Candidatus Omnitrophota bacterium]